MELLPTIDISGYSHALSLIVTIVIGLLLKTWAEEAVTGFMIWMGNEFSVGDHVYIDGQRAVIISQSIRKTIFQLNNGQETTWLYVFNSKFMEHNIEKIVG